MNLTPYHAKFVAYELTRRCPPDSDDRLAGALVDAQVDLNPHQIEAALFAFRSPLSRGVLLADEVGLGKTIEAGLVVSQKWAERLRRILVVTPANLRKQWHQELTEKFFLPCRILEARSYNEEIKHGRFRPFEADAIVICSYQFARIIDDQVFGDAKSFRDPRRGHGPHDPGVPGANVATAASSRRDQQPRQRSLAR